MAFEIERKFRLLTRPSESDWRVLNTTAWEIRQAYVTPPGWTPEVRIRESRMIESDSAYESVTVPALDSEGRPAVVHRLAVKVDIPTSTDGGVSRHEIEREISGHEFGAMWETTEDRRLRKMRVEYMADLPDGGPRIITVDLFQDELFGLMLAEIEFGDWTSSVAFEPPGFLSHEVTHDKRYRNAVLATATAPPSLDDGA